MEPGGPGDADAGVRGRVVRSLLRQLFTVTALVVLYFALPLDRVLQPQALLVLAVGLLAFGALAVWEVRAILRSPHPVIQAMQALAVAVPLYLLLFATVYYLMSLDVPTAFSEELDRIDALYFTVTVFATVGFGDIAPASSPARAVVLGQMVTNLVVLGLLLRVVTGAIRINRGRRAAASSRSEDHRAQ